MNRIDPDLFSACFTSWACELRDDAPAFLALDGKTALHLVSAFATAHKLVLGQEAVAEKSNEITAIPLLPERLTEAGALAGALVTIDAIACNPAIAEHIVDHEADYLLAVKDNQPTLHDEIKRFFDDAPAEILDTDCDTEKGHGRIEQCRTTVCHGVDWMTGSRRFPGEYRFAKLAAVIRVEAHVEHKTLCTRETRHYICSRPLSAEQAAHAVRAHWRIESAVHWVLDVTFKEAPSRVRKGHGAKNMAVVRHVAINIVRNAKDRRSIKLRRQIAGWDPNHLQSLITPDPLTGIRSPPGPAFHPSDFSCPRES